MSRIELFQIWARFEASRSTFTENRAPALLHDRMLHDRILSCQLLSWSPSVVEQNSVVEQSSVVESLDSVVESSISVVERCILSWSWPCSMTDFFFVVEACFDACAQ